MRKPAAGSTSPWALVLRVWHDYREAGLADPELAELPSYDRLQEAGRHTDLDKVIIDEQTGTVYIEDALLRLDVGRHRQGLRLPACEAGAHGCGL